MTYGLWSYRDDVYPDRTGINDDVAARDMRDDMERRAEAEMREDLVGDNRQNGGTASGLVGYTVEALDGSIGKIDEATQDATASYVVVDTGPWIFGRKVMLPAGVISRVDSENQSVSVNRTKDEIKNSPLFDDSTYRESTYRDELGAYYGPEGAGFRDW